MTRKSENDARGRPPERTFPKVEGTHASPGVSGLGSRRQISHYRILGELGRGGMGIVHLAEDMRLGRLIALKVLPPEAARDEAALEGFEREARHLARLNHPNIATIHSLEESDGIRFLTMERIEGETLARRLVRGPLTLDETLAVSRQIAAAFQAAHQSGIIHRDLKPQNVMLAPEDRVKILDFGLAAMPGSSSAAGTPGYMSPEQIRSEPTDARADVWSFGCTLFECLSGRLAFPGNSIEDRLQRTLFEEPDWSALPEDTPPLVRALLASCLEKDMERRAHDISELRRQLEDLLAHRAMMRMASKPPSAEARTNLPHPISRFVGRESLSREIRTLLEHHRLVTLTGFGGTGKTRLAIEVGRALLPNFPGGIWIAELAPLADPHLVPDTVAGALGLRVAPNQTAADAIRESVQTPTLLILDNCEHVASACAHLVSALLAASAELTILATSRAPLGLGGERTVSVPPLSLPPLSPPPPASSAQSRSEAVELFLDRAQMAQPAFTLTAENEEAVLQICRQLDGIALAIELAAARLKVLPVEGVAARLADRFRLLRGSDPTASPHHRTLQALVDWSFDQLDETGRAVLRRLSTFAGGWTLEAAEAICAGAPVEEWEVLDQLSRLVERSLVEFDPGSAARTGQAHYRMLETVRAYGLQKLEAAVELEDVRARHAHWFAALAAPDRRQRDSDPTTWYERLEADHDNVRAALSWHLADLEGASASAGHAAARVEDPLAPLRFVQTLTPFWIDRGHHREARRWLERALAHDPATAASPTRAAVVQSHGNVCFLLTDYEAAVRSYNEALALVQQQGDRGGEAAVRANLGTVALYRGDHADARWQFESSYRVAREIGDFIREMTSLTSLGILEAEVGDHETALRHLEQALQRSLDRSDATREAFALSNLGLVQVRAGRLEAGRDNLARSVVRFREIGNRHQAAMARLSLAEAHSALEELDQAMECARSAAQDLRYAGQTRTAALTLRLLARLAAKRGRSEAALTLYAAYTAIETSLGIALIPESARDVERIAVQELRAGLPEATGAAAWSRGLEMDWESALNFGLSALEPA